MPTLLAIESSCDETAVAIIRTGTQNTIEILASEIASQIAQHREYGGVVPELASRSHSLCLSQLTEKALKSASQDISAIDAFAATIGPGLASSLLIGSTAAKAMACIAEKPFLAINHMEGHLLSPFIPSTIIPPHIGLIISGGHTLLMKVNGPGNYELLGSTRDDAAGEAYDKVGKMLGLPYPGGPEIETVARQGNPHAYQFPRSMLHHSSLDFSFSGLKTAVLYTLQKDKNAAIPDIAASFQAAVCEVLLEKTIRAAKAHEATSIALSGGVSLNQHIRTAFARRCEAEGIELFLTDPDLCADNAAMIAFAGILRHLSGQSDALSLDIDPGLKL